MIKQLQKKFVLIAALSLFIVELAIVGGINAVNIYQTNSNADNLLKLISDNGGVFPDFNRPQKFPDKPENINSQNISPDNPDRHRDFNEETKYQTRYFTVFANEDNEITRVDTGHVAAVTSEQAIEYGKRALEKDKEKGTDGNYRYLSTDDDDEKIIVFIDCRNDQKTKNRFLLISCTIGLAGYLVVCLLIIIFSKKAIRPVIESFEKQKQFITDAGHEIKTPLAIISANTEVIEMTSQPNEWTESIKNQVARLNGLIRNLLSLAKMEEDKVQLAFEDFNISDAVYDAAAPFVTLAQTKGKSLEINVQNNLIYHGDEGAVRQLVSILTENAVKYSDDGGKIILDLSSAHNGKEINLQVSNPCSTPPAGNLSKLFDRFYRADSSRARSSGENVGGYGIGLSIAKEIVKTHKGRIICSVQGKTIAFTASFPKAQKKHKK
ncbi:MAG: sensor histidine kinase [Oscillospiraceae bacterium]